MQLWLALLSQRSPPFASVVQIKEYVNKYKIWSYAVSRFYNLLFPDCKHGVHIGVRGKWSSESLRPACVYSEFCKRYVVEILSWKKTKAKKKRIVIWEAESRELSGIQNTPFLSPLQKVQRNQPDDRQLWWYALLIPVFRGKKI